MNEQKISQILGGLVVVVVGVLLYNYFSGVNQLAKINDEVLTETQKAKTHVVAKGEHLWQIADKYYADGYKWTEIAKANNISNPDVITEGQELTLPEIEVKAQIADVISDTEQTLSSSEYSVQPGDTLWKISVKTYADGYQWTKIYEANKAKIANPNIIETGTVLQLPR